MQLFLQGVEFADQVGARLDQVLGLGVAGDQVVPLPQLFADGPQLLDGAGELVEIVADLLGEFGLGGEVRLRPAGRA